jgi:hypothetical protein
MFNRVPIVQFMLSALVGVQAAWCVTPSGTVAMATIASSWQVRLTSPPPLLGATGLGCPTSTTCLGIALDLTDSTAVLVTRHSLPHLRDL